MKLKYIISTVLASVVLFAGCAKEDLNDSLAEIQVSKSYVSVAESGSTEEVNITSSVDWHITSNIPEWLDITPVSGSAGQTVSMKITAPKCEFGREAEIQIKAGVHTQFLTVRQGTMAAEMVTCKESMEGIAGKTYRVKGMVSSIVNTDYGNLYINDGSGVEAYVYGTLDKDGKEKNFKSLGIELGDVITVEGPLSFYGTTAELVNVTVLKIEKSLLKVLDMSGVEASSITMPSEGGNFELKAAYKGSGVFVSIPKGSNVSLLGMDYIAGIPSKLEKNPADTAILNFYVTPNEAAEACSSTIAISSSKGKETTTQSFTVSEMGLAGTLANPFTVAQAIAYCASLGSGATSTKDVYIKGKVSQFANNGQFGSQYGNGTFWISDDGIYHDDLSLDFEAYRVLWLDNQKWVDGNTQLSVGDEVIICGKLTMYNGTAETSSGKAYVYSVNGISDAMIGDGSLDNPFNVAAAISFVNKIGTTSSEEYYVKGKVSKVVYTFSASYGTGTFWISDNGEYADNLAKDFEAYSVYWFNNKAWVDGDGQVAVGDEVILHGLLTYYKGTAETSSKKAYVYSLNGKTE